jgi:hypothetical protein
MRLIQVRKWGLLFVLLSAVSTVMAEKPEPIQKKYWHDQVREVRYRPVGEAFVNENGNKRFSRAIYGTNTGFRFETSDYPEFGLYMPNLGGSVYLAIASADTTVWVKDLQKVESRFVSGKRIYTLKDKRLLGKGSLQITALALSDADGFILQMEAKGLPKQTKLLWIYGGASDKRFSRSGDIGADPADCFYMAPEKCAGNEFNVQGSGFTVVYGKDKKQIFGLFPVETKLRIADGQYLSKLPALLKSGVSSTPLLIAEQPLKKGLSRCVWYNPSTHSVFTYPQLAEAFVKAETFRASIVDRVKIVTPDPYLNTLGGILAGAEDAIWESPSYLHGAIGWRVPLTGWRASYLADVLGIHDRARMHFDGYAKSQLTEVPVTLPPIQDPKCNLSRAAKIFGTPMYSNGYISRYPNKVSEMNHYDMNLVYIDELLWHLNWTGDLDYAKKIFPVIKRHLAWEKQVFDADNDALYDGYCCIWASDGLQYNGGVATHSTAYNYRANQMAAEIARLIGEDPAPFQQEADRILAAINQTLWLKDKGWWAEFKDNMGNRMIHEDAAVWTVYHAIDSDIQDPFQAYQATRYVDTHIPHIPVLAKNLEDTTNYVVATSDWQPYNWSINNVAFAEITHTALAFWQAGRPDEAFKMYKGALLDAMYLGSGPGNITQISFYDAARGETYRDFADPVATAARAMVHGLFGIYPDLMHGKLTIRPGFPAEWNEASIKTQNMSYQFSRYQEVDTYLIQPQLKANASLTMELDARKDKIRYVIVNGERRLYTIQKNSVGKPKIVIDAGFYGAYEIKVVWDGKRINDSVPSIKATLGESLRINLGNKLLNLYDPQSVLAEATIKDSTLIGFVKGAPGDRTVFAEVRQGDMSWWKPVSILVEDSAKARPVSAIIPANTRFEKVDLAPFYNDNVSHIYAYGKYLTPRWPYTTLQVPTQGMGEWCHPEDLSKIDDRGLRAKAGAASEITFPNGVPFATPGDSVSRNIVFTTLWDNYPDSVIVPLSGRAYTVHLLLAASTYHMQSHILNGSVTVTYTDGSSEVLDLILPETLLPLDQELYTDGYAFRCHTPRPYRIRLKTGDISQNHAADLHLKMGNGPMYVDGGLATMMELPLNVNKSLQSLKIKTVANEVIIGLMSATLTRPAAATDPLDSKTEKGQQQ